MELYIYSDESGVFDKKNNRYYIFAGILFLNEYDMKESEKIYRNNENKIKEKLNMKYDTELKANNIINCNFRRKLLRSSINSYKFVVIIDLEKIFPRIYENKKTKQRYLDYAYKRGLKKLIENLIDKNIIDVNSVKEIKIWCDEHTTATNGKYELRESIHREFKIGIEKFENNFIKPPILKNLKNVNVAFSDSKKKVMIRYADILANNFYKLAHKFEKDEIIIKEDTSILYLP